MLSKLAISAFGLCVFSAFGATLANDVSAADQQINKQIDCLQAHINELRAEQRKAARQAQKKTPSKGRSAACCRAEECPGGQWQYHTSLGVGPYLNKDAAFDGSELIVNVPTVRGDSRLLLQQYQLMQECHELGIPTPDLPEVTLGGKLEGQTAYGSTYQGSRSADVSFSGAELDTYVQGNSWVSGYMALDYDPDERRDGSRLFMNRAFITIGNLSQFPLYASIGQVYVPFGRYSSLMVTTPVTQALVRTRARTLTLGYQQTGSSALHTEVYAFQGLTNNLPSRSNQSNEWGTDIGYEFNNGGLMSGEVGAGYISNLADSQGMQARVFSNTENLRHRVPALNVYGTLAINPVVFLAEYAGAVKSFDVNDISFANQGARPTAFHTEASYTFKTGSKPSSIGVGYGHTSQALAVGLPQDRYSVFYNVDIWRDTNLALEYRHDVNYPANTIVSTGSSSNPAPSANNVMTDFVKSDNVVTVQFDLFF